VSIAASGTEGLKSGGRPFVLAEQHRWLRDIATLKTILLLVGTIITAATPVFTKRSTDTEPTHALLLQQ